MSRNVTLLQNLLPGTKFSIHQKEELGSFRKLADTLPNTVSERTWLVGFIDPETIVLVTTEALAEAADNLERVMSAQPDSAESGTD